MYKNWYTLYTLQSAWVPTVVAISGVTVHKTSSNSGKYLTNSILNDLNMTDNLLSGMR